MNESPWHAFQADDSTSVENKTVLLVSVQFIFQDDVHEDMLCMLSVPTNTTGAELFKSLNDYMSDHYVWEYAKTGL